jgi:hypothetical protein
MALCVSKRIVIGRDPEPVPTISVFMYCVVTQWLSIFVKYINKRYEVEQKMAAGVLLNRDYSVQFFRTKKDPLDVSIVCVILLFCQVDCVGKTVLLS